VRHVRDTEALEALDRAVVDVDRVGAGNEVEERRRRAAPAFRDLLFSETSGESSTCIRFPLSMPALT
jgi:hypothetical protein